MSDLTQRLKDSWKALAGKDCREKPCHACNVADAIAEIDRLTKEVDELRRGARPGAATPGECMYKTTHGTPCGGHRVQWYHTDAELTAETYDLHHYREDQR
jgi:hypothetical protein